MASRTGEFVAKHASAEVEDRRHRFWSALLVMLERLAELFQVAFSLEISASLPHNEQVL